eukprot:1157917-Pelagomonas_calceolata.AAC.6
MCAQTVCGSTVSASIMLMHPAEDPHHINTCVPRQRGDAPVPACCVAPQSKHRGVCRHNLAVIQLKAGGVWEAHVLDGLCVCMCERVSSFG